MCYQDGLQTLLLYAIRPPIGYKAVCNKMQGTYVKQG